MEKERLLEKLKNHLEDWVIVDLYEGAKTFAVKAFVNNNRNIVLELVQTDMLGKEGERHSFILSVEEKKE